MKKTRILSIILYFRTYVLTLIFAELKFRIKIAWYVLFNCFLILIFLLIFLRKVLQGDIASYFLLILLLGALSALCFIESRLRQANKQKVTENALGVFSPHRSMLELRLNQIPNPPFDSRNFLADLDKYYSTSQGITQRVENTRAPTNYLSQHINILNGIRSGSKAGIDASRTIYMLGGSTVLCLEGPDEWTLPSQLQNEFSQNNIQIKVVNVGVSGATTFDRFIAANELITTKPGDILFFWFGVNEGKGLWGRRGRSFLKYWPGFAEILDFMRKKSRSVFLSWLYIELVSFNESAHRALAKHRASVLRTQFKDNEDYWAQKGVRVVAGLQPTIFSSRTEPFTRELLAKNWKPEMQTVMDIQYGEFKNSFDGATFFFDFSNSADSDSNNSFVDWAHLSWRGNQVVARAIFNSISRYAH